MRWDFSNRRYIQKINVLSLLFIAACACVMLFFSATILNAIVFTCILFVLMLMLGYSKVGVKFLLIYFISYAWLSINLRYEIKFPSPLLFSLVIEMLPIIMPAYLLFQAPSGKLTAGLRQLPIPSKMRLPVIVILRFLPTIIAEFIDVRDAMRTRGFLRSPMQVILHPLTTFEYLVVPMIFRSLKIADELASSCTVRGIESPYKKQGYYINKMTANDVILMAFFLIITVFFIL